MDFIGAIAIALGAWLLWSALANWEWYKGITDFAVAETLFGEDAARWLCGLSGLVTIGLGIAVLVRG